MASTSENDDERKIREYIEADPKMRPFFESLNSVLQDYFVATMSVRTGDMAAKTESKNKAMLSTLLQGIPLGSQVRDMNAVMKAYVSLDMTRAMDNLLSVVPDYTEISALIKQLACNVTLALKNIHIDKLDSTRDPQGIWRQLKDHILSKQPTNVYEEEGMICGMAIVKVCMKGDVSSEAFNTEELLHALGFDRTPVKDAIQHYRREALNRNPNQ